MVMLVEALDKRLRSQYDLVCFEDMADVLAYHSTVFRLMTSLFRERYENNERLVFYTAEEPTQLQIDHIQRAAVRTDISNFFILIVCPFDLIQKIEDSNRKFGHDGSLIQSLMISLENTKPFGPSRLVPIDSLCAFPFMQVNVGSNGRTSPCCKFQQSIGNLHSGHLDEIWTDLKIESIRQEMRTGQRPTACEICWQNEDAGTTSLRQLGLYKHGSTLDHGWLDDVQIRDIIWSPTSLCNFSCRICRPESSTSLAAEEIKFAKDAESSRKIRQIMSNTNNRTIPNKMLSSLNALPHLEGMHVLGGEPLIWPELPRLIDLLVADGKASRMTLELNTNCSVYPEDRIQMIIDNFHAVQILLSLDNIGARFEIERGGRWDDILANVKKFAALRSARCEIQLAVTVNLQNILYLDDVIEFSRSLSVPIVWWYLEDPEILSIDRGTECLKQLVTSRYTDHDDPELRSIARRVANSPGSDGRAFLAWCAELDFRRKQSFSESHAEVYAAMGG